VVGQSSNCLARESVRVERIGDNDRGRSGADNPTVDLLSRIAEVLSRDLALLLLSAVYDEHAVVGERRVTPDNRAIPVQGEGILRSRGCERELLASGHLPDAAAEVARTRLDQKS